MNHRASGGPFEVFFPALHLLRRAAAAVCCSEAARNNRTQLPWHKSHFQWYNANSFTLVKQTTLHSTQGWQQNLLIPHVKTEVCMRARTAVGTRGGYTSTTSQAGWRGFFKLSKISFTLYRYLTNISTGDWVTAVFLCPELSPPKPLDQSKNVTVRSYHKLSKDQNGPKNCQNRQNGKKCQSVLGAM